MRDESESSLSTKESYTEELLPAKAISVILGLHDRSKDLEERRWSFLCKPPLPFLFFIISNRKHIRVSKVIVHENFSNHTNDIALLKLGKYNSSNESTIIT